jgi:hypothetical protein
MYDKKSEQATIKNGGISICRIEMHPFLSPAWKTRVFHVILRRFLETLTGLKR